MDEKDCLILQYLYKDQNLTKAAERLYMTQPALTYRVRQIEKEFQIDILAKNGEELKRRTWMLYRKSSLQLASVSKFVSEIKKLFCYSEKN